jgi:hypothetical protein
LTDYFQIISLAILINSIISNCLCFKYIDWRLAIRARAPTLKEAPPAAPSLTNHPNQANAILIPHHHHDRCRQNKPPVVVRPAALRSAGLIKSGQELEVKASGGVIPIVLKLPSADDEYTPEQRARSTPGSQRVWPTSGAADRTYGPFDTADAFSVHFQPPLEWCFPVSGRPSGPVPGLFSGQRSLLCRKIGVRTLKARE